MHTEIIVVNNPSFVSSECCGLQSFLCIRALLLGHC